MLLRASVSITLTFSQQQLLHDYIVKLVNNYYIIYISHFKSFFCILFLLKKTVYAKFCSSKNDVCVFSHLTREKPVFSVNSFFSRIFFLIFIGVQLLYNVVLVSAVQQSELATRVHISPFLKIFFSFRSPRSIEYSSLSYTIDSHNQSSIMHSDVYMSVAVSQFIPSPTAPQELFLKFDLQMI